jgi:hypothetical protein
MKRILIIGLVFVGVIIATAWASYSVGHRRGYERGLVLGQKGAFVGSFDALQKIRAGDIEAGTRRIETTCFSAADTVYAGHPECDFVAKTFLNDFRHYRQTYRTNGADWSVAEQNLERKLVAWK